MWRIVCLVFVGVFAATAGAQEPRTVPSGVQAGARVRASSRGADTVIGRVLGVNGDTLRVLRDRTPDTASVAISRLATLDLSTGRYKRRWTGAPYGLFVGAALGAALGAATYRKQTCAPSTLFCDVGGRELDVAAGAVLLGGVGTVVGAVVGAGTADRWQRVLPPESAKLRLIVPPAAGRFTVGASLRF